MLRNYLLPALATSAFLFAACGGDDNNGGEPPFGFPGSENPTRASGDRNDRNDGDAGGDGNAGPVTLTTQPGRATAAVDGRTIEYQVAGSLHYSCELLEDRITINYQTGDGHDLLIQGSLQPNGWVANITFQSGDETNVQYSAKIPADADAFGLDGTDFSFEGTVTRIEGRDLSDVEEVPATIAVNCAAPGGDLSAMIGGETFVVPLSGAQSVTCDVSPDRFEVRINRLATEGLQLEAQGRQDGANWVGAMVIYAGDERFTSPLPQDGEGLEIDGSNVTYTGTFEDADGEEAEGSLTVTCQ
jgi:hypothetical protein